MKFLIQFLSGLFHKAAPETAAVKGMDPVGFVFPDEAGATSLDDLPPTLGFVSRQPIYDRSQRIVAYEFAVKESQGAVQSAGQRRNFDEALIRTLKTMNIIDLLAYRRAFIDVSLASVGDGLLRDLPADSVIYLLDPLGLDTLNQDVLKSLDKLRAAGLRFAFEPARFALTQIDVALQAELFQRADYMVLDFAAPNTRLLMPTLEQLPLRYPQARWLARNINTAEELELSLQAQGGNRFFLLHGSYLAVQRFPITSKEASSQGRILEIMRLLRINAPAAEIEAQFKMDSRLLFRLLRYVNAPIHGYNQKIKTLEESLLLLGHESLFKWLALLLFTSSQDNGQVLALLEKSLARASFMEKLSTNKTNKIEKEHLFLTGMFSMLAALLDMPLANALKPLDLPFPITDALLQQKGMFFSHLQLAEACERGDADKIARLAEKVTVDLDTVNRYYMEALVWAQEALRESEAQHSVEAV